MKLAPFCFQIDQNDVLDCSERLPHPLFALEYFVPIRIRVSDLQRAFDVQIPTN